MERRLAAILAADVVGYSRLMEADEVGTFAALQGHRDELIDPRIADHHGRIVKLMGDGTLVEFASVVDAVECAFAIQRGMAERNAGISVPQARPPLVSFGINRNGWPASAGEPAPRPPARVQAVPLYQSGLDRSSRLAVWFFIPALSFQ